MDAAGFSRTPDCLGSARLGLSASVNGASTIVDAAHFRKLLVSNRRMVRADRREQALRGLEDLDTGEIFLTEERHLLNPRRELFGHSN